MRISPKVGFGAMALASFIYGTDFTTETKAGTPAVVQTAAKPAPVVYENILEKIHRYDGKEHSLTFGVNEHRSAPVTYTFADEQTYQDFTGIMTEVEAQQGRLGLEGLLGLCRKVDDLKFGRHWNKITQKETTNARKALVDGSLYSTD